MYFSNHFLIILGIRCLNQCSHTLKLWVLITNGSSISLIYHVLNYGVVDYVSKSLNDSPVTLPLFLVL